MKSFFDFNGRTEVTEGLGAAARQRKAEMLLNKAPELEKRRRHKGAVSDKRLRVKSNSAPQPIHPLQQKLVFDIDSHAACSTFDHAHCCFNASCV